MVHERLAQLGVRVRQERKRRSWSREQMARRAGVDRSQVERLENGEPVRAFVYFRCAWAVDFDLELVARKQPGKEWTPSANVLDLPVLSLTLRSQELDDMDRRLFIGSLAAVAVDASIAPSVRALLTSTGRCPLRSVAEVEQLAADCAEYLRRRNSIAGSGGSLGPALALYSQVCGWRDIEQNAHLRQALDVLGCDLGAWVGGSARASGKLHMAERHLNDALTRSRLFGFAEMESRALDGITRLWRDYKRPDAALQSARLGADVAPNRKIRALMHFHAAVFSARLGDEASFERHAEVARCELAGHVGNSPTWIRGLTTGNQFLGLGCLSLGRTDAAIEYFQADARDPHTYRIDFVHSQVLTGLALAQSGDISEAGRVGGGLVGEVQGMGSQMVRTDMQRLRDVVAENQRAHPFVLAYDSTADVGPVVS